MSKKQFFGLIFARFGPKENEWSKFDKMAKKP